METLIVGLRMLCDHGRLGYKMGAIVRIVEMGADWRIRFN